MAPTPHIHVNFLNRHGVWRVEVDGSDDAFTAGRLSATLQRVARAGCPIVVDLSAVHIVDGSVLAALNESTVRLEAAGCAVRLVRDPRRPQAAGEPSPLRGLTAHESLEDALESLGRSPAPRPWVARRRGRTSGAFTG